MSETTDTRTRRTGAGTGTGGRRSGRVTRSPEERAAEVEALAEQLNEAVANDGRCPVPPPAASMAAPDVARGAEDDLQTVLEAEPTAARVGVTSSTLFIRTPPKLRG